MLDDAAAAAVARGQGVYLVGGTVRDLLLGEPGFDVDLAVEGDGQAFARALATGARRPGQPHDAFGTAVVEYGDGERVDVVTARRERYEAPAALPTVEPSTIEDDLFRRDFTINAMAVALDGRAAGRLVDPFEGRRDLEAKTIRVLHDGSFVDDPTRIFRALRYASRYGFELDEHTDALAREAIEAGLVGRLSPARLRDELVLLLDEPQAERSLARLERARRRPGDPPCPRRRRGGACAVPAPAGAARPLRPRDPVVAARPRRAGARRRASRGPGSTA